MDLKPSCSLGLRDRSWSRDRSHMHVYIAFVAHTTIFVLGTRIFSRNSAILTATRFSQLPNTPKQQHPSFIPHAPPSTSSRSQEPWRTTLIPLREDHLPLRTKSPFPKSNTNTSF